MGSVGHRLIQVKVNMNCYFQSLLVQTLKFELKVAILDLAQMCAQYATIIFLAQRRASEKVNC